MKKIWRKRKLGRHPPGIPQLFRQDYQGIPAVFEVGHFLVGLETKNYSEVQQGIQVPCQVCNTVSSEDYLYVNKPFMKVVPLSKDFFDINSVMAAVPLSKDYLYHRLCKDFFHESSPSFQGLLLCKEILYKSSPSFQGRLLWKEVLSGFSPSFQGLLLCKEFLHKRVPLSKDYSHEKILPKVKLSPYWANTVCLNRLRGWKRVSTTHCSCHFHAQYATICRIISSSASARIFCGEKLGEAAVAYCSIASKIHQRS